MQASIRALTRPGNLSFPSNLSYRHDVIAASGRIVRQPSGHLILYGPHGRRILAADPDGNALHECEWSAEPNGAMRLVRARFRLDWGRWVGLKPSGLINSTVLDLSRKPGWQGLRADDLRQMAAQALRVPLDEVRVFYRDEDLVIDAKGQATITHRKDAFYILDGGTFDRARFMACMGAMHWHRIDFLPVVELFQSLLPGTGSAAFELIRGLYDDQNSEAKQPLPLQYRGIPTYPSEAAFRLFSAFFVPQAPHGDEPFGVFMNPSRSHQVIWLPSADPPRRYYDADRRLCITVKGDRLQKVTLAEDPTGLPYVNAPQSRGERQAAVERGTLLLIDGASTKELPVSTSWGALRDVSLSRRTYEMSWRDLFVGAPPDVSPEEAFGAVLLYPDDAAEIDEAASQPFVADYVEDILEDSPQLRLIRDQGRRTLIDNFDGALQTCISLAGTKPQGVLYTRPAFAQKHAQMLWNAAAQANWFGALRSVRLMPRDSHSEATYRESYDWICHWVPFSSFDRPQDLTAAASALGRCLMSSGVAFIVGPWSMGEELVRHGLRVMHLNPVETLPTFRMHQRILPQARLKPSLTLFQVVRPT